MIFSQMSTQAHLCLTALKSEEDEDEKGEGVRAVYGVGGWGSVPLNDSMGTSSGGFGESR